MVRAPTPLQLVSTYGSEIALTVVKKKKIKIAPNLKCILRTFPTPLYLW